MSEEKPWGRHETKWLHEVAVWGIKEPGEYQVNTGYTLKVSGEVTDVKIDLVNLTVLDTKYLDHGNGD